MELTPEEKDLLNGKKGKLVSKLMRLLITMGEARGAQDMVEVYSVHTSTMILEYAGYPAIELMEELRDSGVKFKVHTTVDPVSIDIQDWHSLGITKEYAEMQLRSVKAFADCGGVGNYTCTPWVSGNTPRVGEHVAWVETSAVVYANSVLGARTNRHVDPSALAVAICGRTPNCGYHLDENRRGEILIEVKTDLAHTADYAALGAYAASKFGPRVYVFEGIPKQVSMEALIRMSAAMSTWGNVAMYHIAGVTPEAPTAEAAFQGNRIRAQITVGKKELDRIYEQFPRIKQGKKLVVLGCPHCTHQDLKMIARLIEGRQVAEGITFWVLTSRGHKNIARDNGWLTVIENAGGKVIADMCHLCSPPAKQMGFDTIATDSAKAAMSGRARGRHMILASIPECIEIAVKGD